MTSTALEAKQDVLDLELTDGLLLEYYTRRDTEFDVARLLGA